MTEQSSEYLISYQRSEDSPESSWKQKISDFRFGEVAKDANESTGYGENPEEIQIKRDEIGDVFFSLLALAESLDIDVGEALDEALEKYGERINKTGSPTSE